MHPQVQLNHGQVGPDVAHLLLAGAPHFLDVVKVLLDRGPVGEGLQGFRHARGRIGAKQSEPAKFLNEFQTAA